MRLSNKQMDGIILSLSNFIGNERAELRLYGSRVNDRLKGGDIDLLLLVEKQTLIKELHEKKHYILSAIKKIIDDQKIDLLIADKSSINDDNFLKMIVPTSVAMYTWA